MCFSKNILDSRCLKDRSDRPAGNDARSWAGRGKDDSGRSEPADYFVWNRLIKNRHIHLISTSIFHGFIDGRRNFIGFAVADPDAPLAIAYDDKRGKTESTTTFYHCGAAINFDHIFNDIGVLLVFLLCTHYWFSVL